MKLRIFSLALVAFVLSQGALASERGPHYELRGFMTDLWDHDVDYFSPPITLHRTEHTNNVHYLDFNILEYRQVCLQWQQVCVRRDRNGRCIRWQRRCVRVGYRTYPIRQRVELDFRNLPPVGEDQEEIYEIDINRQRPAGNGRDWVRIWFDDIETLSPVRIRRWSDYRWEVVPADDSE